MKLHPREFHAIVSGLLAWFAKSARDLPWRRTRAPYAIWISEIMLQQTQVQTVIPYFNRWLAQFPDIESLANAPEDAVLKLWEGLGYYSRARNLHKAANKICTEHAGVFPNTVEGLLALPGIGRYTAGAIASIAFNQPAPILDGNVIRVLCRLQNHSGDPNSKSTRDMLWALAGELVQTASQIQPSRDRPCSALNQSLMELGALICTPRNPACDKCPVKSKCKARAAGTHDSLPRKSAKSKPVIRHQLALIQEHKGRFLLQRRTNPGVNKGLWEFPTIETSPASATPSDLGLDGRWIHLRTIKHSITKYRIHSAAWYTRLRSRPRRAPKTQSWLTPAQIEAIAMPSAHRRHALTLQASLPKLAALYG